MPSPTVTIPAAGFHNATDVALLPLLKQFQVVKPQSNLIQALINEQQAADTVSAIQKQEEAVRADLKRETAKQQQQQEDEQQRDGGNHNHNHKNKKSSKKSNKYRPSSSSSSGTVAHLEAQIVTLSKSCAQARQNLDHFTLATLTAIQQHYTNVATKLDPDQWGESLRGPYEALMDAYDHWTNVELRIVYVREMVPVMKAVGDKKKATEVMELPYIRMFHAAEASSPIVQALLTEQHQLAIFEELRRRMSSIADKDMGADRKKLIRDAQESLETQTLKTSELIRKHYRRKSIKLHPDRNGEVFRTAFEEFTDARDVLADETLRQKYLKEMMSVFRTFGVGYMESSHRAWIDKNRPDKAESSVRAQQKQQQQQQQQQDHKPLTLEGGLHHQTPKGPLLQHDKKDPQTVTVSIHALRPVHEFYSRVRSIRVDFKSADGDVQNIDVGRADIVKNIHYDHQRGTMYGNLVQVGSAFMNPGHWEVLWYATLDTVGTDPMSPFNATVDEMVRTKPSAVATFHVVDKDYQMKLDTFEKAEKSCAIVKSELRRTLDKLKTQQETINDRYGFHHNVLVRAGKKARNLKWAMKETGRSSNVYESLSKLLEESRQVFSDLQEHMNMASKRKAKKDNIKHFKAYVASILESEDPTYWMMEVSQDTLKNKGGDSNRLYQLFIEGKGKYVLLVDSDMYKEASLREDLFSAKQCTELVHRGEAMRIQEAKEEEEAIVAEAQKILEEERNKKLKREAELNRKWNMIGNTVTIRGLTSAKGKKLNSSIARVLDYSIEKDRFQVSCVETKEKAYLKEENFTLLYYGSVEDLPPLPKDPQQPVQSPTEKTDPLTASTSPSTSDHRAKDHDERGRETDDTCEISSGRLESYSSSNSSKGNKGTKNTIFIAYSKLGRLIGKKGRTKNDVMSRSGANINIVSKNKAVGGRVPVHLTGNNSAVQKALVLIQEIIGSEFIFYEIVDEIVSVTSSRSSVKRRQGRRDETANSIRSTPPTILNEVRNMSLSPDPMIEVSNAMQSEMPSEIGIERQALGSTGAMLMESMTLDASAVSSLADRSQGSRTFYLDAKPAVSTFPEKDPLLVFLRSQHMCIKGNVDDFFLWLVRSEDIDSMETLKEAILDDEYLSETLQQGNGTVGIKGFKRKAFKRAIHEYNEGVHMDMCISSANSDRPQPSNGSKGLPTTELESNQVFLPSYLYDSTDTRNISNQSKDTGPPSDLYCPIEGVLMLNDPVLAADGVTYERSAIERWFETHMADVILAEEELKRNPHSLSAQETVYKGIRSPVCGTEMPNLCLFPNTSIRNMARAHQSRAEK